MSLLPFCQWLAETQGSIALHESSYMYPLLESSHVLTLCLFVGMSVLLDLRLLGWTMRRIPVGEITSRILPWMIGGFVLMVVTGLLLFYAIPIRSYQNVFFRLKMITLVLAGLNAWTYHVGIHKKIGEWGAEGRPPRRARWAGAMSLILWAVVVVSGRMIAYNWFDCDLGQSAFINWAAGCVPGVR